jgi:protein ImuB
MPPTVLPWFVAVVLPGWERPPRALARLAEWCLRFTPRVHCEEGEGLPPLVLLDASGCLRANGGAPRLCARVARGLARRGIAHAIGSAPSPGEAVVRAMGAGHAPVDDLPIACLRLPAGTCAALREVNLLRIGELRAVARASLVDRYGPEVAERLDMAAGRIPWPFRPIAPPAPVEGEFVFASPCAQAEAVALACRHAVEALCTALAARDRGVRALRVRVEGARLAPVAGTMHLGAPTRDPAHLWSLLRPRIERLHLGNHEQGEGIERIALTAARMGRCPGGTPFLGGTLGAAAAAARADDAGNDHRADARRAVGELVDQLRARLGDRAVVVPEP